jgi:hypothetical protein
MKRGGYIYLIQEREHIRMKEPIYKIGHTVKLDSKRIQKYPKGSRLFIQLCCNDSVSKEKELIQLFKEKYKQRIDFGRLENFEGDPISMVCDIYRRCMADFEKIVPNIDSNKKTIIDLTADSDPESEYTQSKSESESDSNDNYTESKSESDSDSQEK